MGRLLRLALLVSVLWAASASAENHISAEDCRKIADGTVVPKGLPADIRDACAAILAAPVAEATASAASDPCGAPGTGGSVYCWGPWSVLAPAAAGPAPDSNIDPIELNTRDFFLVAADEEGTPPPVIPPPELPLGGCEAGASCGYASLVGAAGSGTPGDADDTTLTRFELADDGTGFRVNTQDDEPLTSAQLTPIFADRPDGAENMRSVGVDDPVNPQQVSQVLARVLRRDGNIDLAADVWGDGNPQTGEAQSGFFAWGRAISQDDIDNLRANGTTLTFSGPMSVDNSTIATINATLETSTWSGQWVNPGYTFSAGGRTEGASFGSDPAQFSSNVQGGFVEGAIVGPPEQRAVSHAVDVQLSGVGRVRDVGLALQTP